MRRQPSANQEATSTDTESASTLISDLTASRTGRNKCLLFKPSVYDDLLQQPKWTKITIYNSLKKKQV